MLALIRWAFGGELRRLNARLTELEHAEQERERVVTEQLRQLARYWKREQTRASRAAPADQDDGLDPISRMIIARRTRNAGGPQ